MVEFLFPVPKKVLFDLMNRANRARDEGEKYTQMEARVSYMMDEDQDRERSLSEYARIWGWSKSTVYRNIDQIRSDVQDWRTFFERERAETERNGDGTAAERQRNGDGTGGPDNSGGSDDERNGDGTAAERQRNGDGTHTNTDKQINTHSHTGARERDPPGDPVEVLKECFPDHSPNVQQADRIRQTVDDLGIWTKCCEDWAYGDYNPWSPKLLDFYREQVAEKHEKDQQSRAEGSEPDGKNRKGSRRSARERANGLDAESIKRSTERSREMLKRFREGGTIRDGPDPDSG